MQSVSTIRCIAMILAQGVLFVPVALALIIGSQGAFAEPLWLETEDLAGQINKSSVLIVDSRAEKDYRAGHIPGATNLPVDKTFDPDNKFRVVGLSAIQKQFREAGIEQGKVIVIYDDGGFIDAGRLFWVMEAYGITSGQKIYSVTMRT